MHAQRCRQIFHSRRDREIAFEKPNINLFFVPSQASEYLYSDEHCENALDAEKPVEVSLEKLESPIIYVKIPTSYSGARLSLRFRIAELSLVYESILDIVPSAQNEAEDSTQTDKPKLNMSIDASYPLKAQTPNIFLSYLKKTIKL